MYEMKLNKSGKRKYVLKQICNKFNDLILLKVSCPI